MHLKCIFQIQAHGLPGFITHPNVALVEAVARIQTVASGMWWNMCVVVHYTIQYCRTNKESLNTELTPGWLAVAVKLLILSTPF